MFYLVVRHMIQTFLILAIKSKTEKGGMKFLKQSHFKTPYGNYNVIFLYYAAKRKARALT